MDVFRGWENYTERISANWKKTVKSEDTVVIGGDISWATDFAGAKADFEFLHSLPGKKILLKGNHDYWWSTVSKIIAFFKECGFDDFYVLHNNFYTNGKIALCGTRGWIYDGAAVDEKVINRECGRLERSLSPAVEAGLDPIVFLHYPPAYGEYVSDKIADVLFKYNIKNVYYGHIHGYGFNKALSNLKDIKMKLVSADCIDFTPFFICKY